jgi:hypothetical protein
MNDEPPAKDDGRRLIVRTWRNAVDAPVSDAGGLSP